MDLKLTEEQILIKSNARRFFEKEIAPLVDEYEYAKKPITRDIVKKLVPFGYIGGQLPEESGGFGLDSLTYFLMIEELARAWPSLRAMTSISNSVLTNIYEYGTGEQRKEFVEPLLRVEKIGFSAITEPNVGSDAASIETTATLKGDRWVINGTKMFISNGMEGDLGIVIAQTDKSKGIDGIARFIVEKGKQNYLARPIEKMGNHCSPIAELVFEDCELPRENLLGEVGQGLKVGLKALNKARIQIAFICSGIAQACVDLSVKYARERVQFGKPIGSFQLIQAKIADMLTQTSAMRLLGYQAACLLGENMPCVVEASMAKMYSSEAVLKVADQAIQIHGGYGYSREFPLERYYRDARHLAIAEGTNEIQRLIIGRKVIGISAFK